MTADKLHDEKRGAEYAWVALHPKCLGHRDRRTFQTLHRPELAVDVIAWEQTLACGFQPPPKGPPLFDPVLVPPDRIEHHRDVRKSVRAGSLQPLDPDIAHGPKARRKPPRQSSCVRPGRARYPH